MKKFLTTLVAILALGTSGCAILQAADSVQAQAIATGIELVTSVYISHNGGTAAAIKVENIALELESVASGNLTVAQFNTQAAAWIAKLSPTDQILAQGLLLQLDAYFAAKLGNAGSLINATTSAAAAVILNDVIAACVANGAPAPSTVAVKSLR